MKKEEPTIIELKTETQFHVSLRQWYAGMAMQGFISYGAEYIEIENRDKGKTLADVVANRAFFMADAMIKEGGSS